GTVARRGIPALGTEAEQPTWLEPPPRPRRSAASRAPATRPANNPLVELFYSAREQVLRPETVTATGNSHARRASGGGRVAEAPRSAPTNRRAGAGAVAWPPTAARPPT